MRKPKPQKQLTVAEAQGAIAKAMPEAELQNNVRSCALANGWLFYHTHRSDRSDEGFYDCTMMRRRGKVLKVIFAELKREKKNPTNAQQAWIDVSSTANGLPLEYGGLTLLMDTFVWRPADWLSGRIIKELE